ncbi:endopeptidase La [Ilumatobacter coccineus]|uniref:Lon protease n=1 Tax=Ilumatobacter coccineus (strain NBRC 103263 / KCTC 29153 / YM16-304) TaxID=1313172 RepID=A0A6C7E5J9_ILUCY|nr:endopeptidase La [Ilumatobacter coccineus]BAN00515.1 ATP-dependent protease La [Ilumatobacter coccineus YM16-304]
MSNTETLTRFPLVHLPSPVLPGATVTIAIASDAVRVAIEAARAADGRLLLTGGAERTLGVIATVPNVGNLPTGEPAAIIKVDRRARILAVHESDSNDLEPTATFADAEFLIDQPTSGRVEAATRELRAALELIAELRRSRRLPEILRTITDPGALADAVALWAEFGDDDRLRVLQAVDVSDRVDAIHSWARNHLNELQVAETIRNDVSEGMNKQQREFLLRQQLNSIRKELGEGDDDVVGEYRAKLDELDAPDVVKNFVAKELDRFERMNEQSPEHSWVRTWLDRIFEMPWGERSDDELDLAKAQEILDADHYGLDDVKERIIEFLAARKLRHDRGLDRWRGTNGAKRGNEEASEQTSDDVAPGAGSASDQASGHGRPDSDGSSPTSGRDDHDGASDQASGHGRPDSGGSSKPSGRDNQRGEGNVITLVGPPGVGKTSLGESIARAMGREFVRVALGGVRDEAEIRGHRRTYVGSQPGRIVRALQEAGTMNPVILLDEVDKLTAGGWSGDPTAALLEVLDPAQNHTFRDHYLEVDLDLSEVVFIATANVADTIPAPLLDRMDLVQLDGYTEAEKLYIANRYLLPRQIERAGLTEGELVVDDELIGSVIRGYTREAGVRSLERELGRLVRKVTSKVATGTETPVEIDNEHLSDWLGRPKVDDEIPERTSEPGIATGLAVTGVGGDVLFIETTAFPTGADAEPGLTLTGQLGDVMKESAQIALNYVRSHATELGLDDDALRRRFHIHVPAGAVPKDGPSAGITMTTALVSLLTDRSVKSTVGMTGEITLQGQVLPIGGVKQKVLAAHRMGLTEVVLPKRNGPDIDDVPESVRNEMTFHLASTYDEVLAAAF